MLLARRIVEAHGGAITAESAVGQGTTVRISLPIRAGA
ncbi:MAG: ATP-binding protein [Myxococcales bacterium]